MEKSVFLAVFVTVFLAELGDKTQLATLLFAADREVSKWHVFLGSALALVVAAGIGVLAGSMLSHVINEKVLSVIAGVMFIMIGVVTLYQA